MPTPRDRWRGRGSASNPPNRFTPLVIERDQDWDPAEDASTRTRFLRDESQSVISYNDSPDLGFNASLNPYRGCEHGCAYSSRPVKTLDSKRPLTRRSPAAWTRACSG